jgi:multidrug efflux pump subunit AcrA (membrane-fusion protein)
MTPEEQQDSSYCLWPPCLSGEVEITEQVEGGTKRFVVSNRASLRYFLLKQPECMVLRQLNGINTVAEVAEGGRDRSGPRVSREALITFLSKIDSLGLLARGGAHHDHAATGRRSTLYRSIRLFNPDRALGWLNDRIGWALTRPVITGSFVLMLLVAIGLLMRADQVVAYSLYTYARYGLVAILLMTLMITLLHEFAHGLACKHFGGEVREMGLLMIYYVLPAFYCNVSDIYRIGQRKERLWVICAGIYWQLTVSAAGAALWIATTPYTALADFGFLVLLGGTFNLLINCNPLIKLDGYYALSQWLGVPNLQARSRAYVGSLASRLLAPSGLRTGNSALSTEHSGLYLAYWLCSVAYSIGLTYLILVWAGDGLMDHLGLLGALLTVLLGLLLTERWWKPALGGIARKVKLLASRSRATVGKGVDNMSATPAVEKESPGARARWVPKRAQVIKWSLFFVVLAVLVAPWEASTGSDCALLLPPGREAAVRANIDAVLADIYVQPGDTVAEGTRIGRLANPEIEDRLTQLTAEITRLDSNASRIEEELRVRSEMLLSANFTERERKRLAAELKSEASLIARWGGQLEEAAQGRGVAARAVREDNQGDSSAASPRRPPLPPALAVLQSEAELKETELEHNRREVDRYRKLFDQGLVGSQQYDRAVAAMRMSEKELQAAKKRLEAAMIEHGRATSGAETSSLVAETEARAARSSFEALISELHSNRLQLESLKQRREILQREYEGMNLLAPRAGVVLGEDLRKMIGRSYSRGEEICRIGQLERFLLKIDVSEREIAEVRLDSPVRFKLKTVPGRTFTGVVSKINAESTPDQYGRRYYPVEVSVENSDGLLRPGMTGFARISFGRQSIGLILGEKVWHALRPELWLF